MLVAVIDVGSNTARLLVARRSGDSVDAVREKRAPVALGDEIARFGRICVLKLAAVAECAREYARVARELGAAEIDVIVTAPGRQAENGEDLVAGLRRATGSPVRVLSADEEGLLAYEGALGRLGPFGGRVAVCDVGGGSTEVVVGGPGGVELCRSFDIGSLRITRRFLESDPPAANAVAAARGEIAASLATGPAPAVEKLLATGGTARSLRKLTGARTLAKANVVAALEHLSQWPAHRIANEAGIDVSRARTLCAGTLILAEVGRRFDLPLEVARGGIREGAARRLLDVLAAA